MTSLKGESPKEIPVIIYSTGMNDRIAYAAMGKGAFACVKKEYTIKDLVRKLKTLLAESSSHRV